MQSATAWYQTMWPASVGLPEIHSLSACQQDSSWKVLVIPHLVIEVPVQAQDVGVTQVGLDLDLSPELMLNIGLLELRLEQDLQCDSG